PIVDNIDVGYQAVRAGSYARASPSTLGNAIVWGVNETPGSAWGRDWPDTSLPAPGVRAYDGRKDYSLRGRLYFRSLYDPEAPNATNLVERWESGRVMALSMGGGTDPLTRKLFTVDPAGARTTVTAEMEDADNASPLFPDSLCDEYANGRYTYDLNNDGKCGTPSITAVDKRVTGVTNDRNFLREWLHGWEDHYAPGAANVKRPWTLGGINLSTVALAVPPYLDTWAQNTRAEERDEYRKNFMEPLAERPNVAYVGTMNGFLHAFDAGAFRNATQDACATGPQLRGYFQTTGSCSTTPGTDRDYGSGQETFAYLPRTLLERYRNLYVQFPGSGTLPKPQVDASPTIANVDFGINNKPAWTRATSASKTTGAKTVLVSASGKNSPAVFALDITNPNDSWYPLPLWEFNLKDSSTDLAFLAARLRDSRVTFPDNSGSRHAPSVARLAWGSSSAGVWTAVVGTDYVPSEPGRAGALYLVDMKTGRPLNHGSGADGQRAGIITLDAGSGVAAESALVDLDRDGTYDVIYVPTTAGSVYRINLNQVDTSARLGRKVSTCKVANAPLALAEHEDAAQGQDQSFQQIYSNLAVKVIRDSGTPRVEFFFGTGDNPDEFSDGPANKSTYRYHLMAYEDADPSGANDCELLDPKWVQPLDPGQTVWGGVTITKDKVFATTAVGRAADICNLSDTESGRFYETGQLPEGRAVSSSSLGGHGVNAPVVHDEHLFVLTATGEMKMVGGDDWNNGTANSGAARSRILLYEPIPDGRMPK
ncbi:pilus assembly protein, partial [Pyxidicoccus sp. 3LG]